jgi:chloride channel 3/4/5
VTNFDVHGFPVIVDGLLLGYANRDAIQNAIGDRIGFTVPRSRVHLVNLTDPILSNTTADGMTVNRATTHCTFVPNADDTETLDLSACLTSTCMRLRQETPLEIVVRLFQSLNISFVLFTSMGTLTGMMSRVSTNYGLVSPCLLLNPNSLLA